MELHRINSIADLQAEQDRLKGKMQVTRNEFRNSATRTTVGSKEFLLKNILLPVGAVGLGLLIAKKLTDRDSEPQNGHATYHATTVEDEKPVAGWFSKLMLVALPLVQQFFLSIKAKEEAERNEAEANGYEYTRDTNNADHWMATLIPMAIPLLQQYFVKKDEASKEQIVTFDADGNEVITEATTTPKEGASAIFESLYKMLPVVLPLMQQFLAKKPTENYAPNGRYEEAMA